MIEPIFQKSVARLVEMLDSEVAERSKEAAEEPELPKSAGRYATEPQTVAPRAGDPVDSRAVRSSSG